MLLDDEACWRATRARDRRFAGQFFIAVRSTGIYCRPGCPAPMALRRNVSFFAHAAAAETAGFRPCLRCRPDAAPGAPVLLGTEATVARALKLIGDGGYDEVRAGELAARLGVGERHLRRLFAEHVGVSPGEVARTRRIHFARKLVGETALPLAEVAFAAGFASVRRFNEAIRDTFRRTPRELRQRRDPPRGRALTLELPFRAPFDWEALVAFLAPRALPGIEEWRGQEYFRTCVEHDWAGVVCVRPRSAGALELVVEGAPPRALGMLVARARRLFDLDADPRPIFEHLAREPRLASSVAARPGLRVPGSWCRFEMMVRAILGQQVSVAHATRLAAQIATWHGERLSRPDGALVRRFPSARTLARAQLRGMPRARALAIRSLAQAVARGALDLDGADREALLALPGVGPWTADYFALRAGHPDALPAGDLGLKKALGPRTGKPLDAAQVVERAEAWRPWRAYAVMHLWETLGPCAKRRVGCKEEERP